VDVKLDATGEQADATSGVEGAPEKPSLPVHPPLSRALIAGIGTLFGLSTLGMAFAPYLAVRHPLLLIALNPWPRHVILVAPHTPMIPLVLIAAFRGLCSAIVAYEVGIHYGPQGIELFERHSPRLANFVRAFERIFSRAAPLFLFLSPGPMTSTLAAVSGNSRIVTWGISWIGFGFWAFVNYKVGDFLKPWTAPILKFIQSYLLETTILCAVLVLGYQWLARKRRLKQAP
jgi:hypothetical protein